MTVLLLVPLAGFIGCSDDGGDEESTPMAGRAGSDASAGNMSGEGGSDEPAGGRAGAAAGARSGAGVGGGSTRGGAGSTPVAGSGGSGGNVQPGAGESSGGAPDPMPPAPGPDGKSAYAIECHGDSLDCDDPALRCLGLRDAMTVLGYSCSNECRTSADCSDAPSGAQATASCVDFALAKHCMLVCRDAGGERTCPTGMSCYEYPGAGIGYCLWR